MQEFIAVSKCTSGTDGQIWGIQMRLKQKHGLDCNWTLELDSQWVTPGRTVLYYDCMNPQNFLLKHGPNFILDFCVWKGLPPIWVQLTPDVSAGVESCFPFPTVAKWVCMWTANLLGTINWDTSGVKPGWEGVCTVALFWCHIWPPGGPKYWFLTTAAGRLL